MTEFRMTHLADSDPAIAQVITDELSRQRGTIELIASENFTSPAVLEAMGSVLTNKYAEGYPAHRYYGGCEQVDVVEDLARERACACSAANLPTCSPIAAPTRISPHTPPSSSRATRSWA